MGDELEDWFNEHYPKSEQPDVTDDYPQADSEDDEPFPKSDSDILGNTLAENERLKNELEEANRNVQNMMANMSIVCAELQRYQDATPLLYKLLTDLDLDEYRCYDYELLLSGDVQTERNEMEMEWVLRRVKPELPEL